jgi:hypothetical protein
MSLVQSLEKLARFAPGRFTAGRFGQGRSAPEPDLREVLERTAALAGAGRGLEALAYAAAEAARLDDAALWARIGELRLRAVPEAVAQSSPRPEWPPALDDPFPGLTGIPEIAARELDWRIVGGAVLHHGSLLVRGLVDAGAAARMRQGIDEALDAYDAFQAAGEGASGGPAYMPLPIPASEPLEATRPWSRESGGVWAAESPRLFQALLSLYRSQGLLDAVGGYLGEQPLLSVGKTVFRRAEPDGHGLFHQDGAFMGTDIRTLNVWTALSDCGEDAPGLEVVARRIPYIVETGTPGAIFHWAVARTEAERAADGAPIVFPRFKAGDALIFDQLMLHATGVKPGMTRRRYALESWFFAPSSHAADQVPIVI